MGMDGLSMSNTGILKESTSADFTNKSEQVIQQDPTNDTKQVQTTSTNRPVREKDEEEQSSKKKRQDNDNEFEDGFVDEEENAENSEDSLGSDIEDLENPNKDFYVKLDAKHDTIELYDSSTDKLIETISGNELGELLKKLNMASGIFINKKV